MGDLNYHGLGEFLNLKDLDTMEFVQTDHLDFKLGFQLVLQRTKILWRDENSQITFSKIEILFFPETNLVINLTANVHEIPQVTIGWRPVRASHQ
jgi:hypothetical protein